MKWPLEQLGRVEPWFDREESLRWLQGLADALRQEEPFPPFTDYRCWMAANVERALERIEEPAERTRA